MPLPRPPDPARVPLAEEEIDPIVTMVVCNGVVYVATTKRVFRLVDDVAIPVEFSNADR